MKKSQIQEIKEGRAMREKTYEGRIQPFGPMPKLPDSDQPQTSNAPLQVPERKSE